MICTTVRNGQECVFMSKRGCGYKNGSCLEIIEKCVGCNKIIEFSGGKYCSVSPDPSQKWHMGNCNMASHIVAEVIDLKGKKINPLKASKRGKR